MRKKIKIFLKKFGKSILLMLFSPLLFGQTKLDHYEQAFEQFESGLYQQALDGFNALLAEDNQNPSLIYNVGLCYQSLGDFEKADGYFSQLLNDADYADWATYQLAMMDWKQGFLGAAEIGFTQIVFSSNDADLVELATLQYQELLNTLALETIPRKTLFGSFGLAYGIDNNIVDTRLQNTTDQEDNYIDMSGSLTKEWLDKNKRVSWQGQGFIYVNQYDQIDSADASAYNFALDKFLYGGGWQFSLGVEIEQSTSGGEDYLGLTALNIKAKSSYLNVFSGWLLHIRYADMRALDSDFDQLAGTILDINADYRIPLSDKVFWQLGVYISTDERDSVSTGFVQSDLSADRRGASTSLISLFNRWQLELGLDYRQSDYGTILRIGNNFRINRDDTRIRIVARADYEINNTFGVYFEGSSTENESNVSFFTYEQTTLAAGLLINF